MPLRPTGAMTPNSRIRTRRDDDDQHQQLAGANFHAHDHKSIVLVV